MASENINTVPLALELAGGTRPPGDDYPDCRRVPTPDGLKLQVLLPRLIDSEKATIIADLLLAGIESIAKNVSVERVEISNLRFTPEGVGTLMMFLAIQATSVKHLVIHDVVGGSEITKEDEENFSSLALAFQESRLETLDLSFNVLGSHIWSAFSSQTQLQTLVLENVEMDDKSMEVLEENLEKKIYTGKLSRLCISNLLPTTHRSVECGNNILYRCTSLRSLRWLNKNMQKGTSVPCRGINQLAQKMFRLSAHLKHLELEGAELTDDEFDANGLCGGLKLLNRLNHLKLRNLDIDAHRAKVLVVALRTGRLPLRNLDLSNNRLGDEGASIIGQLSDQRILMTNLKYLNIEGNSIGTNGVIMLFSAFGSKGADDLDIRTDGNHIDMVRVALGIAALKSEVEQDRDNLRLERDRLRSGAGDGYDTDPLSRMLPNDQMNIRHLLAAQASMVSDMQVLQKEVEKLTDERDSLIKAFSVMGAVKHVEERNSVLARLSRLEEIVHGKRTVGKYPTKQSRSDYKRPTVGMSPEEIRAIAVREATDIASSMARERQKLMVKRRPGNIKDENRQPFSDSRQSLNDSMSSLDLKQAARPATSREEIRARVLADVASLQSKKDEVRARILSEVAALQQERRKQKPDTTHALQTKVPGKLAITDDDRSRNVDEFADTRQKRSPVERRSSFSEVEIAPKPTGPRKSSDLQESGGPTIILPDSMHSDISEANRSHLARVPKMTSSEERKALITHSTSDRFQRLLHKQIQNQLFKSGLGGDDSLKSGSQRDATTSQSPDKDLMTNSSHHSTRSLSNRASVNRGLGTQSSSTRSLNGEIPSRGPSLRTFIEKDATSRAVATTAALGGGSVESGSRGSGSRSLTADTPVRATLTSPHVRDVVGGSARSLQVSDLRRPSQAREREFRPPSKQASM